MRKIKWNDGWKFWPDKDSFALVWNVPENTRDISLPHDAMIENPAYAESPNMGNTGYRDGGNYTYVKFLDLAEEETGRKYILRFDGVYCHAMVYVNEQYAGSEAYGYSTFYVNLTPYLHAGRNEIRVQAKNAGMTNSRWYSGSGIYRDVWLYEAGGVYIEPDMVRADTVCASEESALVSVQTTVINETMQAGNFRLVSEVKKDGEVCQESTVFFLPAGEAKTLDQKIAIPNPRLWSDESPELYTLESSLYEADEKKDEASVRFGIRTLGLDAKTGFTVNGRSVRLRGACIHHDSGVIGAAAYYDAKYRMVKLLKEAGFNALRISHHPASPVLLDACDALGMYVMDEFSDMWTRAKSDLDYALDFETWWERDVTLMVRKDYNHPSVVMYSVGNEIPEIGTDFGSDLCARISGLFHSLDRTRYTTAGINGVFAAGDRLPIILADLSKDAEESGATGGNVNDFMTVMDTKMDEIVTHREISKRLEKACASLDVAGYNYMAARYEPDSVEYPNRVMVGSETNPPDIARNWALVEKIPAVIGDFTWTGWDYIGEAGVGIPAYRFGEGGFGAQFPCQLAYCGDLDITGFRRPLSYYREIVFGLRKKPFIAVQNPNHYGETLIKTPWVMSDADASWDWPGLEGKPAVVEVYGPGKEAELFLNGKSLGKKPLVQFRALFETIYEPGVLSARCDGSSEECVLVSPKACASLSLNKESEGEELVYLAVERRDTDGELVQNGDVLVTAEVNGALLLGFGSGNPKPEGNYNEGKTKTFKGRAQIVLRKTGSGPVSVSVSSEDGKSAQLSF